eukprot:15211-Heterococcus_DN1.PRE.4
MEQAWRARTCKPTLMQGVVACSNAFAWIAARSSTAPSTFMFDAPLKHWYRAHRKFVQRVEPENLLKSRFTGITAARSLRHLHQSALIVRNSKITLLYPKINHKSSFSTGACCAAAAEHSIRAAHASPTHEFCRNACRDELRRCDGGRDHDLQDHSCFTVVYSSRGGWHAAAASAQRQANTTSASSSQHAD